MGSEPLAVDHDNVLGALAARRELGPDSESAVVAAFLDHAGRAIDARVDHQVAAQLGDRRFAADPTPERRSDGRTEADRWRSSAIKLALGSFALAIPITGIVLSATRGAGVALVVVVWGAITAINLSFHRARR